MNINKELLKGSTPTMVLSIIAEKDTYGYEIIKELERKSENVFTLKEGTLYPILHALEDSRFVETYWVDAGSKRRKYYHITRKGKSALKEKKEEWVEYTTAVGKVLNFA